MKKFPIYLPRELRYTMFQDIPKHEWADIAYSLASLIEGSREDQSALDIIKQERAAVKISRQAIDKAV